MYTIRFKLFSILTVLLLSVAHFNAQHSTFEDWDTDDDGLIERNEFTSVFATEFFSPWGATDERGIIEEGFFKESYAGLDTDNDGFLSDEEWLIGYNYFYDDYILTDEVGFVDLDSDGQITYTEYYDVIYDTPIFTDIDMDNDNYISEYELADYVFDNWDFNDTGALSRSEFNRFDWYYLDI